jgi:hypothetical protein
MIPGEELLRSNLASLENLLLEKQDELEEMKEMLGKLLAGADTRQVLHDWIERACRRGQTGIRDLEAAYAQAKKTTDAMIAEAKKAMDP